MPGATNWIFFVIIALACVIVPQSAWAWGPATHLHYGMLVLNRLPELTETVRILLSSQSMPFLYGCVSADIVLAKKLGSAMTHCHNWENGIRLIEESESPRIRAFATGYVSHLAADTISHNCYVPSKTIASYDSGILKHMYWELLFDQKVTTDKTLDLFQEIARGDFSDCDDYLEKRVPTRLFDFSLNKRVFNQLLLLQGLHHWQGLWASLSKNNPWPLEDREVHGFTERSMQAIISFLNDQKGSQYLLADPIGQHRLKAASDLRRFYKAALSKKKAPTTREIRHAVERFAREPFHKIDIADHKSDSRE